MKIFQKCRCSYINWTCLRLLDNFKCNSNIRKWCRVSCFLGKVHVWHPREEGALLMMTSLAGGFESHLPPLLKHHFEEQGYLLVSYGFQEGGCVHADFCDECVVASDFLSIKPLRILRFTSHQPCLPANPYPCRSF